MKNLLLVFSFITIALLSIGQERMNDSLVRQLDTIYSDDQADRQQPEVIQNKYASDTLQMRLQLKALWKDMAAKDSVNEVKVKAILDKYGWLGTSVIGADGNDALFLVIQHADLPMQEEYLPMMRAAVKEGNAKAGSLALLEDRVALREGKKQIYGSQVAWNITANKYTVLPLTDPDNVDKRRAAAGLPPLAEYLSYWQMKWDVGQYKKDLPAIEAAMRPVIK